MKTAEEIKKWLDEKKEFTSDEFIQWFETSEIDIPEGIRFIDFKKDNSLGLIFNKGRQILVIDRDDNVFETLSYNYIQKRGIKQVPCKLVECKYEDLVVGDIFIPLTNEMALELEKEDTEAYCIYLGDKKVVYTQNITDIISVELDSFFISFYKVVKK